MSRMHLRMVEHFGRRASSAILAALRWAVAEVAGVAEARSGTICAILCRGSSMTCSAAQEQVFLSVEGHVGSSVCIIALRCGETGALRLWHSQRTLACCTPSAVKSRETETGARRQARSVGEQKTPKHDTPVNRDNQCT